MGGKSSSSTSSSQTSVQQSSEGVVTGTVLQGETINVQDEFPEGVQEAFQELIKLSGQSLNLAGDAGQVALDSINERADFDRSPELATVKTSVTPIVLTAIAVGGLVFLMKGKK